MMFTNNLAPSNNLVKDILLSHHYSRLSVVPCKYQKLSIPYLHLFREVHHTNVVRFIGACTKPPKFCIITGELYDQAGSDSNLLRIVCDKEY